MKARAAACVAVALAVVACERPPTLTTNPYHAHPEKAEVVSVCYSRGHDRPSIEAVAKEGCTMPDAVLVPWRADTVLNECPLMKKRRISFVCAPPGVR